MTDAEGSTVAALLASLPAEVRLKVQQCVLTRAGRAELLRVEGLGLDAAALEREHPWVPAVRALLGASGQRGFADQLPDGTFVSDVVGAIAGKLRDKPAVPRPARRGGDAAPGMSCREGLALVRHLVQSDPAAALQVWLAVGGLERLAAPLTEQEVDLDALRFLGDGDLEACGVQSRHHRRALLQRARRLAECPVFAPATRRPPWDRDNGAAGNSGNAPGRQAVLGASLGALKIGGAPGPAPPAAAPPGRAAPAPGARRGKGRQAPVQETPPGHVLVTMGLGSSFMVDGFLGKWSHVDCERWFLTHFHADHYRGLGKEFRRGQVYCTPVTAALVREELGVDPARVVEMELGATRTLDGTAVTLLDANHCPGAAMVLFEREGAQPVLHTGDFRFSPAVHARPGTPAGDALSRVAGRCRVVLDTTYLDPKYHFPSQEEVIGLVMDVVRAEAFNSTHATGTLFVFGAYTIGKERLYLEVARRLGRPVRVSPARRRALELAGVGEEALALVTCGDAPPTNLVVESLAAVKRPSLSRLLEESRGRYHSCVAFRPTGWAGGGRRMQRWKGGADGQQSILVYEVPYSEHSSFVELTDFLVWLRPTKVVPHVNNDGGERLEAQLRLLRTYIGDSLPEGAV